MPEMPSFTEYMRRIENLMQCMVGLSYESIEDWDYASAYEDGVGAFDATIEALQNAGLIDPEEAE